MGGGHTIQPITHILSQSLKHLFFPLYDEEISLGRLRNLPKVLKLVGRRAGVYTKILSGSKVYF